MEDISGLENTLTDFLKELLIKPLHYDKPKNGFVMQDYYKQKFKVDESELVEMIFYVRKDGFIHEEVDHPNPNTPNITRTIEVRVNLRGKAFLRDGGCVKVLEDKINDRLRKESLENRMDYNTHRLKDWTSYLTYGTVGIVIIEILRMLFDHWEGF